MTEKTNTRPIEPEPQDYLAHFLTGQKMPSEIAESSVQIFCRGCDFLGPDGVSKKAGENDQARYAAREWCGWAEKAGVRGQMTADGFKPWSK